MSNQSTILQVKIPVGLATQILMMRSKVNKYETNPALKAAACFLILKAASPYSLIKDYRLQLGYLSQLCQVSKKTLCKRIEFLQTMQLLQIEGYDIRLNSWKQVASTLHVSLKQFKTVHYDYANDKDFFLRLFAAEIETNKEQQVYMIQQKLRKNPALKNRIQATLLQHGADKNKIEDFVYLHNQMKLLYKNSFIAEPETHALLCHVRPDCNRSVKTIADAWCFKSAQSVSYYKAKLAAANIAVIIKGERIESRQRARNEFSHVLWSRAKRQTVLCLVDGIAIVQKNIAA